MGREQIEQLEKYGFYYSVPKGVSMLPMIRGGKDIVKIERLEKPAKRYDLVMYERPGGQGVIHRVVYVLKDHYVIIGDNCHVLEYVSKKNVKGIATSFYRNKKWYDVTDRRYLLYVHLWTDLLFIRRPLFRVRDKIKSLIKRAAAKREGGYLRSLIKQAGKTLNRSVK